LLIPINIRYFSKEGFLEWRYLLINKKTGKCLPVFAKIQYRY
jgi:hypothetical protein